MNPIPNAEQTESVNGIQMHYAIEGEGEPLVLLHGFTGAGADWKHIFPVPPEGHRLIMPDLRGHGRTTNPSGAFTFVQCAMDVLALLDKLGVHHCKAMGMSGGGQTLLHMATMQPGRVEAIVLISTAHYFPAQAREIMRQMTEETRSSEDWEVMRQRHHQGDDQIRALWRQGHAFKDSHDDVNFTPASLGTITARTLIVHGDQDPLYPLDIANEMAVAIPRSQLWVMPGGGHCSIFGPHTPAFLEKAMPFLQG